MVAAVLETHLTGIPCRRGKVRDVYDLGDRLLLVSTDRISAFDWVLPTPVADKGRVLTQISNFWFRRIDSPHHVLETDVQQMDLPAGANLEELAGRTTLVRKTEVVPIECVVRAYLSGSAWSEYRATGCVAGEPLPGGLPTLLFTPATKAAVGEHDENITWARMQELVGPALAEQLRQRSLAAFELGSRHAAQCGLLLADTKFEFGLLPGEPLGEGPAPSDRLLLIDEALTPDSSRFWPAAGYEPGRPQPSFDKQFVRDWLLRSGWDRNSPPPELPADVIDQTRAKYIEAYERLTGQPFAWA